MKTISLSLTLVLSSTSVLANPITMDIPQYQEQAIVAGIDHQYTGPFEFFVGGGVASFDCNSDRMPDVFIAGGVSPAQLYVNKSIAKGEIKFEKTALTKKPLTEVTGGYPINIDNDEFMDLVVLRVGENQIYRGLGQCQFELANEKLMFDGGDGWTTGFSAIWEKDNAYPTMAFMNYIDRKNPNTPWGTCEDNVLARPKGGALDYSGAIPLKPGYCALSGMFTDWNNSGQYDLRVTNDRQYYRGGQEQLWNLNQGGEPKLYGPEDGWQKLVIWGMGISEADVNKDGRPDYALSSMGDNMLQALDPDAEKDQPQYKDMAFEKGTTAHRPYEGDENKPSTGWHTQFADVNNDTKTDLYIAKGNVERMPDFAKFDPDNLLLGSFENRFEEVGAQAGINLPTRGRGAAVEDFNADGMLDILVVNREAPVSLFRNLGAKRDWGHVPMGNFIAIELQNGANNRSAVGAKVKVKTGTLTQSQTIHIGGGHASGQAGFLHFGLGVAERAEITIVWPNGDESQTYRVFANNFVIINKDRDEAEADYWYPPAN